MKHAHRDWGRSARCLCEMAELPNDKANASAHPDLMTNVTFTACGSATDVTTNVGLLSTEGGNIWSATVRLAHFMQSLHAPLQGARVLELGSGTGVLAMACAGNGAHVLATEAPWMLELLTLNADLAGTRVAAAGGSLTVEPLLWSEEPDAAMASLRSRWQRACEGEAMQDFDLVLACECVYSMEEGSLGEIFGHAHGSTAGTASSELQLSPPYPQCASPPPKSCQELMLGTWVLLPW